MMKVARGANANTNTEIKPTAVSSLIGKKLFIAPQIPCVILTYELRMRGKYNSYESQGRCQNTFGNIVYIPSDRD